MKRQEKDFVDFLCAFLSTLAGTFLGVWVVSTILHWCFGTVGDLISVLLVLALLSLMPKMFIDALKTY